MGALSSVSNIPVIWIVSFRVFTGAWSGTGRGTAVMKTAATSMTLNCADLMFHKYFSQLIETFLVEILQFIVQGIVKVFISQSILRNISTNNVRTEC